MLALATEDGVSVILMASQYHGATCWLPRTTPGRELGEALSDSAEAEWRKPLDSRVRKTAALPVLTVASVQASGASTSRQRPQATSIRHQTYQYLTARPAVRRESGKTTSERVAPMMSRPPVSEWLP